MSAFHTDFIIIMARVNVIKTNHYILNQESW